MENESFAVYLSCLNRFHIVNLCNLLNKYIVYEVWILMCKLVDYSFLIWFHKKQLYRIKLIKPIDMFHMELLL